MAAINFLFLAITVLLQYVSYESDTVEKIGRLRAT